MLRIGVKHKFGFQNTNTDFKPQIRVLILTFRLFQNNHHVEDGGKTQIRFSKYKYGFQNPNAGFDFDISFVSK